MAKFPNLTGEIDIAFIQIRLVGGRLEALGNMLGTLDDESVAEGLLTGDFEAKAAGDLVVIQRRIPLLFDRRGRRIPPRGLKASVLPPNREFRLVQPDISRSALAQQLERLSRRFPTGLETEFLPVVEFIEQIDALINQLQADKQLANLLKGVYLPVCMPHLVVADYGQALDEIFLPAVAAAYKAQFPERSFTNYRQGVLASQVTIVPGTRHERLLTAMAAGPVVGLYFPNPLQGFSVDAQREQMATLLDGFVLSGPLDIAAAWVMHSDVLARDFQTPGYDCSAVQCESSESSLCFRADNGMARFGSRTDLSDARVNYSGGLFFLG